MQSPVLLACRQPRSSALVCPPPPPTCGAQPRCRRPTTDITLDIITWRAEECQASAKHDVSRPWHHTLLPLSHSSTSHGPGGSKEGPDSISAAPQPGHRSGHPLCSARSTAETLSTASGSGVSLALLHNLGRAALPQNGSDQGKVEFPQAKV